MADMTELIVDISEAFIKHHNFPNTYILLLLQQDPGRTFIVHQDKFLGSQNKKRFHKSTSNLYLFLISRCPAGQEILEYVWFYE